MQDTSPISGSPIAKRILIVVGAVLFLAVVSIGTIFLLKTIVPKKESSVSTVTIKPDELVFMYRVPGVISGLSGSLYDQQLDDGTSVPVTYKLDGRQYIASTQTPHNVLFYSKTTSPQDDTKAIQDQTTVFMHGKGYEKVANPASADAEDVARVTYAGKNTVCQLTSSGTKTPEGSPASHQLACTDTAAIEAEYVATEKLLELYGKADKRPSFTEAVRTVNTEGNKAYAILRLATTDKRPTLLFAAIDNNWSYLGDLNGSAGQANAKYVISPEIKAKISDAKYGGFLTKNLQGQSSS